MGKRDGKKKVRNSSIELLRIFSIIGVFVLHYNNPSIGGGYNSIVKYSANYFLLHFLESVFIVAVDVFILITGYFMCTSNKRNFWKPIELIVRVIAYSVFMYFFACILGKTDFSLKRFIRCFIPANYFVILYCTLFLLSPYVNLVLKNLSENDFRGFVILIFVLFAIYPTAVDFLEGFSGNKFMGLNTIGMYGSQAGYCIVNFMLMYVIGAYIRLHPRKTKKIILLVIFLLNSLLLTGLQIMAEYRGVAFSLALEYCNPLVIINASIAFELFEGIDFKSRVVNILAAGSFSVFLLHGYLIEKIGIDWATKQNIFVLIAHIVVSCVLMYLVCCLAHYAYDLVIKPVFRKLQEKIRMPLLYVKGDVENE